MVKSHLPGGNHPRGDRRKKKKKFSKKVLTNQAGCYIIAKLSETAERNMLL